jgi:NAD-dependent SIR2 family protein deacetylase
MKLNDKYLHNNYFYLTCNCCDRLITKKEMSIKQYNNNKDNCNECYKEVKL